MRTESACQSQTRPWSRYSFYMVLGLALLVILSGALLFYWRSCVGPRYQTLLSPGHSLTIVRRPAPSTFGKGPLNALPSYDPSVTEAFQVDLRGADLSGLDVQDRQEDLLHAAFDDRTLWPESLPLDFDPKRLMELGRNPGLQVRELHQQGITGKGIGIGIIDQTLLVEHVEYRDRLRLYEEIHNSGYEATMHSAAISSIAVGKTVGVAPGADLYYIANTHGNWRVAGGFHPDFMWTAQSIERLLAINRMLPDERKIRVISISVGWTKGKGCDEANAAVQKARKENVFVISTSLESTYELAFHGLGRDPLKDPDKPESYGPGSWWRERFFAAPERRVKVERLMVPMDSRCVASPAGADQYVFYASGGWSWAVPYLAGLYALACQVKPTITPEEFWALGLRTAKTIAVERDGKAYPFGMIVDPVAMVRVLTEGGPVGSNPADSMSPANER